MPSQSGKISLQAAIQYSSEEEIVSCQGVHGRQQSSIGL